MCQSYGTRHEGKDGGHRLDSASGSSGDPAGGFIRGFGILLNRPYPVEVFSSHPVSSINVL